MRAAELIQSSHFRIKTAILTVNVGPVVVVESDLNKDLVSMRRIALHSTTNSDTRVLDDIVIIVANENRLPVSREFAPRDRDARKSMSNVEETIILRVAESVPRKAANHDPECIHNPCYTSGPKKDQHDLPRPSWSSGSQWRRQCWQELGRSSRPRQKKHTVPETNSPFWIFRFRMMTLDLLNTRSPMPFNVIDPSAPRTEVLAPIMTTVLPEREAASKHGD